MSLCSYTNVTAADLGTRDVTVKELAHAVLWWDGPEFVKTSKQDWLECKFDRPTSTKNLELKGAKETGPKKVTNYQITEEGGETVNVEEVWQLNT